MHSKAKSPTKAEKAWMQAVAAFGCIVCYLQGREYVPCAVHHLLSGGIRRGHMDTIGLCDPGHHQNAPAGSGEVSRHPNKAEFEKRYGTEDELLAKQRELIGEIA